MRKLQREITVEFKPERSDPYGLDYRINITGNGQTQVISLSFEELSRLEQAISDLFP
jgi:hypothetical protein